MGASLAGMVRRSARSPVWLRSRCASPARTVISPEPTHCGVFPMKMISLLAATVLLGTGAAAQDGTPDLPYVKTASVTLSSTDTGWDYVKFEPGSARLFLARLDDGLTLFALDKVAAVATAPTSKNGSESRRASVGQYSYHPVVAVAL